MVRSPAAPITNIRGGKTCEESERLFGGGVKEPPPADDALYKKHTRYDFSQGETTEKNQKQKTKKKKRKKKKIPTNILVKIKQSPQRI